jgi:hypothetical protein
MAGAGPGCSTLAGGCQVNDTRPASPATEAVRFVTGPGNGAGDGDAEAVYDAVRDGVAVVEVERDGEREGDGGVGDGVAVEEIVELDVGPCGVTVVLQVVKGPAPYALNAVTDTRCGTPMGSAVNTTLCIVPFTVTGCAGPGSVATSYAVMTSEPVAGTAVHGA